MAAGALYRAELAAQLRERLSLTVERVGNWFEVKGVSAKLIAHWSKRRKEIESALEESGYSSAKAAEVAALNTRHTKEHVARHKLFPQWQKDGEEIGWGQAQAEALCHSGATLSRDRPEVAQALAVKEAVAQITREQAYFSEKDLVRRMAEHAVELGLGAKEVLGAAREFLSDRAISLGLRGGLGLFTTPEMLELEKQLLEQAGNLHRNHDHQVSEQVMESVMQKYAHLNPEQREAVAHITVKPEGLALVAGMAGTGKTTMLKAAAEVWEKQGFKVQGAALAGKAAEGLAEEAGIATMTIHKSLFLAENSHGLFSDFKNPLTKNTVLVVDEAGMVGTHLMSRLLNEAEQAGAKVVLVGDARQLQPIEAGGPFASMAEKFGQATLRTIIRQKDQWAREAVHDMADGNAGRALAAFADRGLLTVADTKTQARSELLGCWRKDGVVKPDENLILAGTKKDTALLNKEAQAMRKEERQLGLLSLKAGGDSFHKGDRILFTKNSGPMGVKNGQLGTVTHVDCIASTLYVKLDNKRKVEIPVRQYDHVQLGYAVTTHKSQGMTAQNAFIMTHPSMQDKELSYVQASRARDTTRIFTTKAEAGQELSQLAATMSQSRQKELAADVLTPKQDMEAVNKVRAAIKEHKQRQTLTQELRYHMGLTP
jgi:Ti-type conjugative transfer relaxase TraA